MANVIQTGLAILAVGLIAAALIAMSARELLVAGLCFMSASLVIYFRETR